MARYVDISQLLYPPIDPSCNEIRLLYLLPGPQTAQIRCKLLTTSLKDGPHYEALSYVWGDAGDRRDILLDGHIFSITANLEVALRHLRLCDEERVLWVDALCINQDDSKEKQQQIQEMREIYHSAHRVLAWTGEADEGSDEALDLLNHLSEPSSFMALYELSSNPNAFSAINFNRKWQALCQFLNRPYWTRVWVVQELAIPGVAFGDDMQPNRIQVGAGWTWLPISSFNVALASFALIERSLFTSPGHMNHPEYSIHQASPAAVQMFIVIQSCMKSTPMQPQGIGELLHLTHFLKATDPRDRVYALIALARKEDHVLLPDYSISMTQMLRGMVRHLIEVDKNLAVLSGNRRLRNDPAEDWTSWVPDPEQYINAKRDDWRPEATPFKACTSITPAITFSDDLRLLTVRGMIIGRISTVIGPVDVDTFPGLASKDLAQSAMMQCLGQLEQFASSLSKSRRETFWRTLVMDSEEREHGQRKYPAPKKIGVWFDTMLDSPSGVAEASMRFYSQVGITQRCFYTTSSGEMGLGPFDTRPGDLVTMLYGGQFFYILREVGEHYILVGDSYLHGAMFGELERKRKERDLNEMDFVLR